MFPWKRKKQQGWETRQRGWTEGTYEDIHVPSRVLTVTNRSAIIDYHVSINYLILRCQPVVISLSLSQIVTSMLISRCQAIALSHTHIVVTSMLISRCQNIVSLSLSHKIVTSMLISRCQTIVSLSLLQNCHLDAYFQVSNLPLSLSHNCHPDAYFQLLNHCLSFPEIVTSMLISRCRTIVSLSLSLTQIVTSISFLHTQTNKAQATRMHCASQ
jgi:hypothetical protein